MLAEEGGRYRPVEIEIGREADGRTVVLAGLEEGEMVVASGQFLIDSEASLSGIIARSEASTPAPPVEADLHEAEGRIIEIGEGEVTLAHGPFATLGMPGMTMAFPLAKPELATGLEAGDAVVVGVRETGAGLIVERIEKTGGAP
jgi:Cu(I)/Ag(I) efflux system membrane fusion protein